MANIQNINGASKIQDTYQTIYNNDSALNAEGIATAQALIDHIADLIEAHESGAISFSSTDPNLTKNNVKEQLEQISARISNIIASSGTSSTEVVDARLSSVYGAFATLATRLNYSDGKLKSVEDQIGTQSIGTVNLTPTTSIQSVTDSYDGIIDAEIGGATLYNAPINGDFANGTTGWVVGQGTQSVSNKINTVIGNGSGVSPFISRLLGLTNQTGNKIKAGALKVRVTNSLCTKLQLILQTSGGIVVGIYEIPAPTANAWYDLSNILTLSFGVVGQSLTMFISHYYVDAATANGKAMEIDGNAGVFAIPITGTAYESKTNSEINAMLGEYFEGLKSTNELSILSRGRNLFDNNVFDLTATDPTKTKIQTIDGKIEYIVTGAPSTTSFRNIKVKPNVMARVEFSNIEGNISDVLLVVYSSSGALLGYMQPPYGTFTPNTDEIILQFLTQSNSAPCNGRFNLSITEGSTALPYEPYKNSILNVNCTDDTKFALSKLPNLVQNEVNQFSGYISAVKGVEMYTVTATDITAITDRDNIAYATGLTIPTAKTFQNEIIDWVLVGGKEQLSGASTSLWDVVGAEGKYITLASGNSIWFMLAKGTTLAQAKTALAGTKILYQLATPVFIPYEDFPEYGINVDGALASHSGYTNVSYEADIVPDATLQYSRNIGTSVDGISQSLANTISQVTVHEQRLDDLINDKASSIPTTGTWLKGDKVWNDSPDAGEYIGWVCVVAGTPGTWKGFGIIQA